MGPIDSFPVTLAWDEALQALLCTEQSSKKKKSELHNNNYIISTYM